MITTGTRRAGLGVQGEVNFLAAEVTIPQLTQLIRAEYLEMPGLRLTKPQMERLWSLDPVTCEALLSAFLDVKFLKRTSQGAYVRVDQG